MTHPRWVTPTAILLAAALLASSGCLANETDGKSSSPTPRLGEVLAVTDGGTDHIEPTIAANPTRAGNLIGASIVETAKAGASQLTPPPTAARPGTA